MSSKGYATPLRIEGGALPLLQRLYLLICLVAAVTLLFLQLPYLLNLFFLAAFSWLSVRVWKTRAELGGTPVSLVWDADQRWWWLQNGVEQQLQLCGDSFLSGSVSILNFREPDSGRRSSLVLMPSVTGAGRYRQLLVRFKISADPLGSDA